MSTTTTRDPRHALIEANLRQAIARRQHRIRPDALEVPDPTVPLDRIAIALAVYTQALEQHLAGCRYARAELMPGALEDHLAVALAEPFEELRLALIDELGQAETEHLLGIVVLAPTPEPEPEPATPEHRPGWLARMKRVLRDLAR